MRILLIHQYYLEKNGTGGSRWNEITKVWADKGHQITVLAGMVNYNTGKKETRYKGKFTFTDNFAKNIQVIRCHVSEAYNTSFFGRLWAYFSFVFSSIYAGIFKASGKYDAIIVTSPPLFVGITAYVLSICKNVPFAFEIRDLWPESAIDTGVITNPFIIKFSYWFEAFMYKKATLINVLTPAFREALLNKKNVPENKIIFIPNAADFSLSEQLLHTFDAKKFKEEIGLKDKLVILYCGAHGVANHLQQIFPVAKHFKNTEVVFLLIGDGMKKNELIEEAKNQELNNILFLPPVSKQDIFKYILASDISSSILKKIDTFKTVYSNKTFDYMSCKKPILMAIDGASRELVEVSQSGLYVDPESTLDWISKIETYRNNPDLLNIHGENGYKYAKANFARETLAHKYLEEILSRFK